MNSKRLTINQLDRQLSNDNVRGLSPVPRKGWVSVIRCALGMTAAQLGRRVGVSQSAITKFEKSEAEKSTTLATLEKVAKGLDCQVYYCLVPNVSLDNMVVQQAREIAKQRVLAASHSMSLEDQSLNEAELKAQVDILQNEILATLPRTMWNDDGS